MISDDLRAKITLTGVVYLNPKEALESTLNYMTMLILLPNDKNDKMANVLLKHVKNQLQRSKSKSVALVLLSSTKNNDLLCWRRALKLKV